jgi:hypothetical protein
MMPESMEFLRGVLGMIALACAYMVGRSLVAVRKGWQKLSRLYGWVIRMTVCLAAVAFRHSLDMVDIAIWVLAGLAIAGGCWNTSHQKPPEDLSREIFPD